MTAALARGSAETTEQERRPFWRTGRTAPVVTSRSGLPPLSPRLQIVRGSLVLLLVVAVSLILQLVLTSQIQQASSQDTLFDRLRRELAIGTVPIGPVDADDEPVAVGTPVAQIEIPAIDVRQVVVMGTTSGALFDGPGVRRDTRLPGQVGVSVVMARRAAYGGPFSAIGDLEAGEEITVTTGQGEFRYEVLGVRREGDPLPPPVAEDAARLVLATADGRAFLPDGVTRVDADIVDTPVVGAAPAFSAATLPTEERFMEGDARTLWALALWLQVLIVVVIAAMWSWVRWGRPQTWVVFTPPLLLVGLATAGEFSRLLPNML